MTLKEIDQKLIDFVEYQNAFIDEWAEREKKRILLGSSSSGYSKSKEKYENSILPIIEGFLKRRGYDKYGSIYTKAFVVVYLNIDTNKNLSSITIQHDIQNSKPTTISESFISGLNIYLNYFERL